MKFLAVTLLFATSALALANPAPAPVDAAAVAAPEVDARTAGIKLEARGITIEARDPKKSKPKTSNNGNTTDNAAGILTPSRMLELGALGLGVVEVVRLWR
ncbi:hypothetical protein BCR34DRAFT_144774 [Clohesyomyces aquaticus]|uniref:Uncharacterized protein n=1 Tax=Clohesyomyces aquaticus TaxID=1231657 RepID=A0A1Y2A0F4_9PLEO|nr:hypothetical protein BCR34DRAFT_144774 [Clohesyomyces aquaticus]